MNLEVKNPVYLIIINWIILLVGNLGIPLIPLEVNPPSIQYILSFLVMNFNFFDSTAHLLVLVISWSVSILMVGLIVKPDWKFPLFSVLAEFFIYIIAIVLIKREAPLNFSIIKYDLLRGYGVTCAFIILLYIPIIIRLFLRTQKQKIAPQYKAVPYILKCPYCGIEYQSNPSICYSCSKHINSL